ncbi:MAG: glycosyltransferase family 4 protein [Ignavibacteriae bacterium]|nr:glycosyltransferase family 4 protein [Ignavibacteriota bacterium]
MANILYVLGVRLPDEVRAEKICRALVQDGHKVTVLSRWFPNLPEREEFQGYTVLRFGKNIKSWQRLPISVNPYWKDAIEKTVVECKPDLIITREMLLSGASNIIAKKISVPSVIDMAENYPGAMRGWKQYQSRFISRFAVNTLRLPDRLEKSAVLGSDGIIVVCDEQTRRLNSLYQYPVDQIVLVQNTPELETFSTIRKGCNQPPVVFGHHGLFTLDRGLENLVRGFELAANDLPTIRLELYGKGETYEDIKRIISASVHRDRMEIYGAYPLAMLPEIYSKVDIGVLPYFPDENFNMTIANKLFDYLSCGKPIIVSEALPMKRIIKETGAGICTDCSTPEKIAAAIKHIYHSNLGEMSENGQKFAKKKYNWAVDSERLCKFAKKFIT